MLIFCEGEVTEKGYFTQLRQALRNPLIHISDKHGVPKTLVEAAVKYKREGFQNARNRRDDNLLYDQIWCVFDVDSHPNIADAHQQARANGIKIAQSNPCFELWLLLHYCDQRSHIERNVVRRRLRTFLPDYKKHVPFSKVHPQYPEAVRRAQDIHKQQTRDQAQGGNPSTNLWQLTDALLKSRPAHSP